MPGLPAAGEFVGEIWALTALLFYSATGGAIKPCGAAVASYSLSFLRRSELVITETELKLMAAAARIGLNSKPKKG